MTAPCIGPLQRIVAVSWAAGKIRIRYIWTAGGGRDLDTKTWVTFGGNTLGGAVGWSFDTTANAYRPGSVQLLDLLHWVSGDNTNQGGEEYVDAMHRAIVCWFTQEWAGALTSLIPEFRAVASLLTEAGRGLEFEGRTVARLRERMIGLGALPPAGQVLELQSILVELAHAPRTLLASGEITASAIARDRVRMQRVLDWLHQNYDQPLRLQPLCDIANLTESQLQRIFKRSTRMSISQYVMQLRIGRACQMLAQTDHTMSRIAAECGFSDAAHFSRQFRASRGQPPTQFRRRFVEEPQM